MSTLKSLKTIALCGALGGSALLLGTATAPVQAAESRLHNEATFTYGLIPGDTGNSSKSAAGGSHDKTTSAKSSQNSGSLGAPGNGGEPQIEDPPLPGYEGGDGQSFSGQDGNNH